MLKTLSKSLYFGNQLVSNGTPRLINCPAVLTVFHNFSFIKTTTSNVNIHTSPHHSSFWEQDKKGGYNKSREKVSSIQHIRNGLKELKGEIALWKNEVKEKLIADPLLSFRPGEVDVLWCFDNKAEIENWITTSDSDHDEGFSKCDFMLSKAGRGLFSGNLDTRVPVDGRIKRSGYCSLRSQRYRKSFKRNACHDWTMYNTLVIKLRGDGRSYMLNLACEGFFDITWSDIYHYVLFTRGGPYWQVAKIPFSKFFLGSKGRIQDQQTRIPLDKITHFGIACGDKIPGNFHLEIEYIGLEFDPKHEEDFAYEMYKTDRYLVGC